MVLSGPQRIKQRKSTEANPCQSRLASVGLSGVPPRCRARTGPGTRCFSSLPRGSLHLDFHAHPRMDAAFKKMFTFRQTRYLELAALQDSRFGDGEIFEPTRTFWCRGLSSIEVFDKAATKVCNL